MVELKQKDRDILRAIESFSERGVSATLEEIGKQVSRAKSNVHEHLKQLEKLGFVVMDYAPGDAAKRSRPRSVRLLVTADGKRYKPNVYVIPWCGVIAAGKPIPLPDFGNATESIEVARSAIRDDNDVFALTVRGDSMEEESINDGDIVLIKRGEVHNGDFVAAEIIKDPTSLEVTLKQFRQDEDRVTLTPKNRNYQPIPVPSNDVKIAGKVIFVQRNTAADRIQKA